MKGKFLKKIRKVLRKTRGYTLIEVAAVVMVTATLSAVVIPVAMDKIKSSQAARVQNDLKALASAIASFYSDVGLWPAYASSGDISGNPNVEVLLVGDGTDPDVGSSGFNLFTGNRRDDFQDQLITNVPEYNNWKGPYTQSPLGNDPWGYKYVIWVYGMHTENVGEGWIISPGANGVLDTPKTSLTLNGDDLGMVFSTRRQT